MTKKKAPLKVVRITTQSGSVYLIDNKQERWKKLSTGFNPFWGLEDDVWFKYLTYEHNGVGSDLRIQRELGVFTRSTPIVSIENV